MKSFLGQVFIKEIFSKERTELEKRSFSEYFLPFFLKRQF